MLSSDAKSNSRLKSQITIDLLRSLATLETAEEVAHKALTTTWRLMGLKHCAIFLSDQDLLRCSATTGRLTELRHSTLAPNAYDTQRFAVFRSDQGEIDFLPHREKLPIKELLSLPILGSRRELLGVVLAGYEAAVEPDETQINQLSLVCTAVANALERIYGQQKLQSELTEKQTLLRLSAMLEGNSDEHIRLALEEIRILAGADVAAITMLDGDFYRPRMWLGDASPQLLQGFSSGMHRDQVHHLHFVMGRDFQVLANQDHPFRETFKQFDIQAFQVISMPTDGQFEGLVLYRLKEAKGWSEAEFKLLRSASQTLGAVITRVARAKRLEARNRELEIVAVVSKALNNIDSVQGAADCLVEQIADLTGAAQTTVNLVSPDGQSVQNIAVYGLQGWVPGGVPKGQGLTWEALEGRQPVFTQDSHSDPRGYFPSSTNWPRSILYVQIFDASDQPLGVLGLSHQAAGAIRDEDVRTLGIIASVAANALQRLSYKQRLEEELRAKEILLELSHLIESDDSESLIQALEQVRGLAQADLVILGNYDDHNIHIQHFVGQPIFPIQPGTQILQQQLRAIGIELRERLHIVDTRQVMGFSALSTLGVGSVYLTTAAFEPGIESGLGFFRREMQPWSELERRVMDGAARMIGALLKRVQSARRLTRQLRETQTLRDTVLAVVENQFEQIWSEMLQTAVEIVPGAEAGSIFLRNQQDFVMVAQHGYHQSLIGIQVGGDIPKVWFESEQTPPSKTPRLAGEEFFKKLWEHDAQHLPERDFRLFETHGKLDQIKAALSIPILLDGELYAYINLESLSNTKAFDLDSSQTAQQFALQITALVAAQRQNEFRQAAHEGALRAIGLALEARDAETAGHTDRVVQTSRKLGQAVGLSPDKLRDLRWGAYLHDLGKIMVSVAILQKPDKLNAEERAKIMRHAADGENLARQLPFLPEPVRQIVRLHHERWDGKGYPDGLAGQEIPLMARIFAVCDVFDALISERPYKRAMTLEQACEELKRCAQTGHLDPELVAAFLELPH